MAGHTAEADLFAQVRDFISRHQGIASRLIRPEATLCHDLGIIGMDGIELLLEFSRVFDVDVSGVDAGRHFGNEGLPAGFWPWEPPLVPITVSQLVTAARCKRLAATTPAI